MEWTLLERSAALLGGGLLVFGLFVVLLVIISGCHAMWLFRGDDRNPYRRHCRKCNQQQDQCGRSYNNASWWEDMGKVYDEGCSCHYHSTYHR